MVTYTYDAWGNPLTQTGSLSSTLGTHNPLRYRGYVYDTDTGLYYLLSRYYDPQMGRFINADALVSTAQGLAGYNMFAYCGNNPVIRKDATGRSWVVAIIIVGCAFLLSGCDGLGKNQSATSSCTTNAATTSSTSPTNDLPTIVVKPKKTKTEKKEFVETMYQIGKAHEKDTGIPAALFAAQASYECGYGTSDMAIYDNNLFGFVGYKYDSFEDSIAHYEYTLSRADGFYTELHGADLATWVYGIGPEGYNSSENYGEMLWTIILMWDLQGG